MNRNKAIKIFTFIFLFIVLTGILKTISVQGLKEFKESRLYFDTYVTIHCYYRPKVEIHKIINECFDRLHEIQVFMNANSAVGHVALINASGIEGVRVRTDVYNLLRDSLIFSKKTQGAFDITVSPLIRIWKKAKLENKLPAESTISLAMNSIGYQHIELKENNFVYLKKKDMKIDLGAIAKGYAVDEVGRILKENMIENFLIDAGGDMLCNGKKEGKKPWRVGVQDPKDKNKIIDTLKLSNMAITTSGDYERFFTINNKKYSHIIDPKTGYPQENVISATVIAPTAKEADAFSTALCVLGAKKGISLINKINNIEAMIIETIKGKTKIYKSKRFNSYR